jgi:hypothetical protein
MRTYKDFEKYLGNKPIKLFHTKPIYPDLLSEVSMEQIMHFFNIYLKTYLKNKNETNN